MPVREPQRRCMGAEPQWPMPTNPTVNPFVKQQKLLSHRDLLPGLVQETVDIEVELFEKYQRKCDLWPLEAVKNFQLLYRQK